MLAYNKPLNKNLIDAKSQLIAETLAKLKTNKITEFFKFVRDTETTLPNDATLKQILEGNQARFGEPITKAPEIEYSGEYPDEDWKRKFTKQINFVIDGRLTTVEFEAFNTECRQWASEFLCMYIPDPNTVDYSKINF